MKEFPVNSRFTHVDKEHLSRGKKWNEREKKMLHVIFLDLLNNFHAKKERKPNKNAQKIFFLSSKMKLFVLYIFFISVLRLTEGSK